MLTTFLDGIGAALIVAAAFVVFGLGAALAAAGVAILAASWFLAGDGKR